MEVTDVNASSFIKSVSEVTSNTLRPRQNGRHFADDIFKYIFLNENVWIPIKISLKFVAKGSIDNILALVQIMAQCRPGDKPLSEPMMFSLPTHICVTWPQWVKYVFEDKSPKYTILCTILSKHHNRTIDKLTLWHKVKNLYYMKVQMVT